MAIHDRLTDAVGRFERFLTLTPQPRRERNVSKLKLVRDGVARLKQNLRQGQTKLDEHELLLAVADFTYLVGIALGADFINEAQSSTISAELLKQPSAQT